MIDDYAKAMELVQKMQAHLPIPARPTKTFIQAMRGSEIKVRPGQNLQIESVLYTGDEGGISCAIQLPGAEGTVTLASLTHIRVPSSHPLFKEIRAYQIERIRKLAQDNRHRDDCHREPTRFTVKPRRKKKR
jgi:hypothetical protein